MKFSVTKSQERSSKKISPNKWANGNRVFIPTLAALLLIGPFTLRYASAKSAYQKDQDNLSNEQDQLKDLQKTEKTDQEQLDSLNNIKSTGGDPASAGLSGDCLIKCMPVSAGGQCPDQLFLIKGLGFKIKDSDLTAQKDAFLPDNGFQIKEDLAASYPSGASVCGAVGAALKSSLAQVVVTDGACGCASAVADCRYNKIDAEIARLKAKIKEDKDDIASEKDDIKELKDRTSDGCDNCGADYYAQEQNGAQKTATILNSIFPYFSTGLNGYLYASGQNKYYSSYNNYLQQCVTIGVPCSGPQYAGGAGLSTGIGILGAGAYMGSIAGVGLAGGYPGIGLAGGYPGGIAGGILGGISGGVGLAGGYPGIGLAGGYPGVGLAGGYPGGIAGGILGGISGGGIYMGGYPGTGLAGGYPGGIAGGILGGISGGGIYMGGYPGVGLAGGYPGGIAGGILGGISGGGVYFGGYPSMGIAGLVGGGGVYAGTYGGMVGAYGGGIVGMYTGGLVGTYAGGLVGGGGYPSAYGGGIYGSIGGGYGGSIIGGIVGGITGGISGLGGYGSYGGITGLGGLGGYGGLTGLGGGYNPYTSQYGSLYNESMAQQMLAASRSAQENQDLMLSQQQVYQAQERYGQTLQSAYSYGGGGAYSGTGIGTMGGGVF